MKFSRQGWCASMLLRPPLVSDGVLRVLYTLGPDLSPLVWAHLLGEDAEEIERALVWTDREQKGRHSALRALFQQAP